MKYDAFISYRHSDMEIAKRLHKGLETFKVPRSVAKIGGKKDIKRVFRDREELPIGSDLGDNISAALQESEYLIVICSPRTPESYWVKKEISTFIEMHSRDHILAVLVEGEPDESFPPELLVDENGQPVEPLAADVRGASQKEVLKKLKSETMRLAAPLLHCSYDDLKQRHRERRIKKIATIVSCATAVIAVLAIAFGIYNARTANIIKENYNAKLVNQSKYLAETSKNLLKSGDREAAILVALEAVGDENNVRPYVADAENALCEALYAYDNGEKMGMDWMFNHDILVSEMEIDKDGKYLTVLTLNSSVYVWDLEAQRKILVIPPVYSDSGLAETAHYANVFGDRVVVSCEYGIYTYSLDGTQLSSDKFEDMHIGADASTDYDILVAVGSDDYVLYDTKEYKVKASVQSEYAFLASVDLSEDGNFLWLTSNNMSDSGDEFIYEYDLRSNKLTETYEVSGNRFYSIVDAGQDKVAVLSGVSALNKSTNDAYKDIILQVFDRKSGLRVFEKTFENAYAFDYGYNVRVYSNPFADNSDNVTPKIIAAIGNEITVFDSETYEELCTIQTSGNVSSVLQSYSSDLGYVGSIDGRIVMVNYATGYVYTDNPIETHKNISRIIPSNGTFYIKCAGSSEIVLLSSHKGKDLLPITTLSDYPMNGNSSTDCGYYSFTEYLPDSTVLHIYSAKDDSEVYTREFTEGNENYKYSDFISDNRYAYLSSSCELTIIDVAKKSEESFKLGHDDYSFVSACNVSANKKFVIIAEMNSVIVFDLIDKKEVANFELPNSAKAVAINNDGSKAFAADMNSGITVVDVKSGKINNEFCVSAKCDNIVESSKGLAFSQDETKLAVVCYDSKVRIVDTATGDIISEIDCPLYGDAFVSFGLNEDDIIVQGGDYTFRVYSMATKELKYEETEIFDSLEKITYDEENNTLALKTTSLVILKDPVDYSTKSAVDSGRIYLKDRVIASDGKDIYSFKLLSKDELVKLAKDTVGRELTDREKVKYHVE